MRAAVITPLRRQGIPPLGVQQPFVVGTHHFQEQRQVRFLSRNSLFLSNQSKPHPHVGRSLERAADPAASYSRAELRLGCLAAVSAHRQPSEVAGSRRMARLAAAAEAAVAGGGAGGDPAPAAARAQCLYLAWREWRLAGGPPWAARCRAGGQFSP